MKIHSLHIYPMKSARVIDLDSSYVGAWGLDGDRRYMVTDPAGKFITQRDLQALAQVTAVDSGGALNLRGDLRRLNGEAHRESLDMRMRRLQVS